MKPATYGIVKVCGGFVVSRSKFRKMEYVGKDALWTRKADCATPWVKLSQARVAKETMEAEETAIWGDER